MQHGRMGLGEAFVGTSGGMEYRPQSGVTQGPVQAPAALAGGHPEENSLSRQPLHHLPSPPEKLQLTVAGEVVVTIAVGHARIVLHGQVRHRLTPGIVESKADDMAGALLWRRRNPEIDTSRHDGPHNGAGGIHEGSEEHTSELQSPWHLVCRLLLEKKK